MGYLMYIYTQGCPGQSFRFASRGDIRGDSFDRAQVLPGMSCMHFAGFSR